jgi:hypothetical protein
MQFVIEHSNTKRKITGEFKIYGTKASFAELVKQIQSQVGTNFDTGWVTVTEPVAGNEKPVVNWDM